MTYDPAGEGLLFLFLQAVGSTDLLLTVWTER